MGLQRDEFGPQFFLILLREVQPRHRRLECLGERGSFCSRSDVDPDGLGGSHVPLLDDRVHRVLDMDDIAGWREARGRIGGGGQSSLYLLHARMGDRDVTLAVALLCEAFLRKVGDHVEHLFAGDIQLVPN